jgi:RNA polymerase sigma-70 factor, ECF subfamily
MHAEIFNEHRKWLFSIAYRMTSRVSDAEDIVQEAYIRWSRADLDEVRSPKAFLATTVTRLAIDHLESARVKRETYLGPWLPEPVVDARDDAHLADSLSMAFLLLLETLTPVERAVFLLREAFDYEYAEIAAMLDKSEANCRQMHSRARRHLADRRPRFQASPEDRERLLQGFLSTVSTGNVDELTSLLAEDATLYTDGGGRTRAALNPIFGRDRIIRFFAGIQRFRNPDDDVRVCDINGRPGLVAWSGADPLYTISMEIENGRIRDLFVVVNPDKLAHLRPDRPQ